MSGVLTALAEEPKASKPLESTTINVDFEKLSVEQALVAVAKEVRSQGGQLNIVIAQRLVEAGEQVAPRLISLHLQGVTPGEAIGAIVRSVFWTFSVKGQTVYVWDGYVYPAQPMATKAFTAPTELFPTTSTGTERFDVTKALEGWGVQFPEGSSALYQPAKQLLIVRNSQADLDLVQAIIDDYNHTKRR